MMSRGKRLRLTLARVDKLSNKVNAELISEFYQFLKTHDTSETWQDNNVKALVHFAETIAKDDPRLTFQQINTKECILQFVDSKRKPVDVDPDQKSIRTRNDYVDKLKYFFRCCTTQN
jgi:integrase/recombinase XerD